GDDVVIRPSGLEPSDECIVDVISELAALLPGVAQGVIKPPVDKVSRRGLDTPPGVTSSDEAMITDLFGSTYGAWFDAGAGAGVPLSRVMFAPHYGATDRGPGGSGRDHTCSLRIRRKQGQPDRRGICNTEA